MRRPDLRPLAAALIAASLVAAPAAARQQVGVGIDYMGFSFDEELGTSAAQLLMVPVAVRFAAGETFALDVYSAWAQGLVERENVKYDLTGVIDTRVKASWQATPWALLSVSASLPTGNSTLDGEEAVVASMLSADLFGFREAPWGTGSQITSSLATAVRAGQFGLGVAASYSVNGEFESDQGSDATYQPGNEARFRVGLDRNFGNSTFTMGATFMTYADDQAQGVNFFQAGNRFRFDAAYAFRAGSGVWTLYAADVWREHGDVTLSILDEADVVQGDTTFATASQNLVVAGLVGSIGLGAVQFRPMIDFRMQMRDDVATGDEGSGWLLGAGGDLPLRFFGAFDLFPKGKFLYGSVKDPTGASRNVIGAELSGTIRLGS
jgi:hypothetical protein